MDDDALVEVSLPYDAVIDQWKVAEDEAVKEGQVRCDLAGIMRIFTMLIKSKEPPGVHCQAG